jgi:hypothetical protein
MPGSAKFGNEVLSMLESSQRKKKFHHIGLRTYEAQPQEHYIAPSQCWITNPNRHPQHIEYLRYGPDSPIKPEFMDAPHVAYEVEDLPAHLTGKEVYLAPFEVGEPPFATVAFTIEDGLFIEYLQLKPGRTWFDDFD